MKYKLRKFLVENFIIDEGKEKKNKSIRFTASLIVGLILGMVFLSIIGFNPFKVFFNAFQNVGKSQTATRNSLISFSIMGLAGLSAIISFRSGVFNIGIAGQMMAGGATAVLFAILIGDSMPKGLGQITVIIISMIVGAFVSLIAILLKIFFKISEVVSTILINWLAFYYAKWLFSPAHPSLLTPSKIQSKIIGENYALQVDGNAVPILVPIFIILAVVFFFVLYKTKFGYEIKLVGINNAASKYAGISVKSKMIYSMVISGAIAGLLGAFMYFGQNNGFIVPKSDTIPSEGFDGIAVALIAFSNPILMIPVALLFTTLSNGIVTLQVEFPLINPTFVNFITGIIMYTAAISIIFIKYKPIRWIKKKMYGPSWSRTYDEYIEQRELLDRNYFEQYKQFPNLISFSVVKYKFITIPKFVIISSEQYKKVAKSRKIVENKHVQCLRELKKNYEEKFSLIKGGNYDIVK